MSMARRIRRQVKDNIRSGMIRRANLKGRAKKQAGRYLKSRDKINEAEKRAERGKPALEKRLAVLNAKTESAEIVEDIARHGNEASIARVKEIAASEA